MSKDYKKIERFIAIDGNMWLKNICMPIVLRGYFMAGNITKNCQVIVCDMW